MADPNRDQLIAAGELLRPVLGDLVFVGGAVTSLLVTDEGAGAPRPTLDVDTIAPIQSYAAYAAFGRRLRALGFSEDTSEGAPVCRWVQGTTILDVMPLDETVLGFSNLWYPAALATATKIQVTPGLEIRVIAAPYFLATKIEAFRKRGGGKFQLSHDLEDVIFVIDGRPTILEEVRAADPSLREYLRTEFTSLVGTSGFVDALPGHLRPDAASQARIGTVLSRMKAIAAG